MKFERSLKCAIVALAAAAVAAGTFDPAAEARPRNQETYGRFDPLSTPVLAVVALDQQHISIYDADGKILEAPVSSGQTGLETPAGIYSIVQKEEEHYSNAYDDASMPFMERITWTGIALHGGVLPGYPASHGCVRMPENFAEKLYEITKLGMRVIVVRDDIAPVDIAQPALFTPSVMPASAPQLRDLQSIATGKAADAVAASRRERDLKQAAAKAASEAASATRLEHEAEARLAKAEDDVKGFEKLPAKVSDSGQQDTAKANALAKVEAAKAQLVKVTLEAQAKGGAATRARDEAQAATVAKNMALDASEEAQQNLSPVSVFISRKTQRLYIRKGTKPVYEGPVKIANSDKPLGTFVFTAVDYTRTPGEMRWNVVSMYKDTAHVEPVVVVKEKRGRAKTKHEAAAAPADVEGAQAALARLSVPKDTAARISQVVLPGSSLIVSDEGPSNEMGKDTDFIVVMSGEPQGGLVIRHHEHRERRDFDEGEWAFWRSPREYRPRGGGFPFFSGD